MIIIRWMYARRIDPFIESYLVKLFCNISAFKRRRGKEKYIGMIIKQIDIIFILRGIANTIITLNNERFLIKRG